jgi:hypothetical protein
MPVPPIHDFFHALDRAWKPTGTARIRLPIIGAGALLLQTSYARLTKDSKRGFFAIGPPVRLASNSVSWRQPARQ